MEEARTTVEKNPLTGHPMLSVASFTIGHDDELSGDWKLHVVFKAGDGSRCLFRVGPVLAFDVTTCEVTFRFKAFADLMRWLQETLRALGEQTPQ